MQSIGSKLDIQRISRDLKVSRPTLNDYLAFLEGTYFIKTIRPFSKGKSIEVRKTPKVYICDTGPANHFARLDEGHIFENSIFQNLRVRGELNYYQRKSGVEIDFILNHKDAYEVKINPSSSDFRKMREISDEIGLKNCRMVSRKFSRLEGVIYGFML
ncbi:MAG: DUF4143 domain-containing protein [Nitrospirota bacterium]